jgi:hypothetical protein
MKRHQMIGTGLGLAVLLAPMTAIAHVRRGDDSALSQVLHQLLHAAQGPAAMAVFAIGLTLALFLYHRQRGDRS